MSCISINVASSAPITPNVCDSQIKAFFWPLFGGKNSVDLQIDTRARREKTVNRN